MYSDTHHLPLRIQDLDRSGGPESGMFLPAWTHFIRSLINITSRHEPDHFIRIWHVQ